MARPVRVEFPGAVYHVTARGNERRRIFRDDADRRQFLATLEQAVREHALRVHAFCLMPNHYHLLVETPGANLSQAIGWLQTTYTIRFNRRHRRSGHLVQGRFKAHLVDADSYATEVLRYIHLNPVRPPDKSAPVPRERRTLLRKFPWSSHRAYLGKVSAPEWLCTDWLSFFGRRRGEAQKTYARFIEDAFGSVVDSPWDQLIGGLALGSANFVRRIQKLASAKGGREEVRWVSRAENPGKRQAAALALAKQQPEQPWQIWVRVVLGGERRIDVALEYGYADGSGVTQALKRLEAAASQTPVLQARMSRIRKDHETRLSGVKR
jgi:REP element-mobilizing transposase RayT